MCTDRRLHGTGASFPQNTHKSTITPIQIQAKIPLKCDGLLQKFKWWDKYARMTQAILQNQKGSGICLSSWQSKA